MDLFEKDFYVLFSYVCYILQLVFMNAMMILSFFQFTFIFNVQAANLLSESPKWEEKGVS